MAKRNVRLFNLSEIVAYAAESILRDGWVPRGKAEELGKSATADSALYLLENAAPISSEAQKISSAALAWAPSWLSKELSRGGSDYLWNMRDALSSEYIKGRQIGFAVSVISAYQRDLERTAAAASAAATSTSTHIGAIGERQDFTNLAVTGLRYINNGFGTTLVTFKDSDGNVIKWFASNLGSIREGDTVNITATVKAHGEWAGVKDTTITRAKVK